MQSEFDKNYPQSNFFLIHPLMHLDSPFQCWNPTSQCFQVGFSLGYFSKVGNYLGSRLIWNALAVGTVLSGRLPSDAYTGRYYHLMSQRECQIRLFLENPKMPDARLSKSPACRKGTPNAGNSTRCLAGEMLLRLSACQKQQSPSAASQSQKKPFSKMSLMFSGH